MTLPDSPDEYQLLVNATFEQDDAIHKAEITFLAMPKEMPLLAGASALHAWLEGGGTQHAGRVALLCVWMRQKIICVPVPLTAAVSLGSEVPWARDVWIPFFLDTLATEVGEGLQLLTTMERAWCFARQAVVGGRRGSRAGLAVDLLAACPLMSATSLAQGLAVPVKNTAQLLDRFQTAWPVVEVTPRHKRRLFGLTSLIPLREGTAPTPAAAAGGRRNGVKRNLTSW
ncbi:MAG: hypothetical protein ACRYFY_22870 [Janthinobacterium lividum]